MSAQIVDFAGTADIYRAARAAGQALAPGTAVPSAVRIGGYVFDFVSKMSGRITHFNHRDGQTKAIILARGCSFAANLPDLTAAIPPKEFH